MSSVPHGITRLATNIREGLTLFGKNPASGAKFSFDIGPIAALLCLLLALDSAIALAFLYPSARFSVWGLHSFALVICSLLIITWLIVANAKTQWQFARVLTMWLSGLIFIVVPLKIVTSLGQSMEFFASIAESVGAIAIALHVLLLYRISRHGLYQTRLKSGAVSLIATTLFLGFNSAVPNTDLWVYDWSATLYDNQVEAEVINTEDVYYKQAALIEQATDNIQPQTDGVKELFFLGFGGEGDNVFKNETLSVQSIVDEKLNASGRSAVLINNADTIDIHPIASVHNLRAMLKNISAKMNLEEDVLMLYLTSHGSRDHQLSVELDYLDLNRLSAEELAAAINETPVKWKVIIISACYSGGFIEPLKDDHTVVITAARNDRTSFGCESENEFTYFGNAYFNEAIAAGKNILESFSVAKTSIALREAAEELTPSEPQIFVGAAVNGYLDDIGLAVSVTASNGGEGE